jgi:protein SCO1/2
MQRSDRYPWFSKAILATTALGVTALTTACKPASFHGTAYDPPEVAPPVVLTTASGNGTFSLADQKGKVVLLYFGYTHCPDMCPTTLNDWKHMKEQLGGEASRVRFVFISVDPGRDDPATLEKYVDSFDPEFIGATSDSTSIAAIEKSFHIGSSHETPDANGDYAVAHSAHTFIVDGKGRLRLLDSYGMLVADAVSDIRQLLDGA